MKWWLLLLLGVLPVEAGFVHTSGVQMLDGNNDSLYLRGVDLGCWLWPEFYMMGNISLPAYASAGTGSGGINNYYDAVVAAFQDALGGDTNLTAQVLDAYWTNYIGAADIAWLHSQGFNSVRAPYSFEEFFQVTNWANNYPSNGFDISTGFKYFDSLLGWCSNNGVYVIPDMHCAPGGPDNWSVTNYGGTLNTNTASVFASAPNLALAEHIWARIAARYATHPWIGGYDLLNEPVNTSAADLQVGSPYLSTTYSNLIRAIRTVDTNHMVICEGDVYASTLWDVNNTGWTDANWCYSDHDYGSALPLGTANRASAVAANVPIWGGEFGINSTRWDNRIIATTYQNPVSLSSGGRTATITEGHCFWAYKSSQFYTLAQNPLTPGWNALAAYWASDNTLPKPSVTNAFTWLMAYAQAASFSNCLLHLEAVDALTRPATNLTQQGFAQAGVPYKTNVTIPGRIFAVDYDMGDSNVVYSDTVTESDINEGVSGPAWNNGWFGRTDGVDETTCDDPGTLLKVGWNDAGEWQRHTVNCTPGTFTVFIRYAGGAAGGQIRLSLLQLSPTNQTVVVSSNDLTGAVSLPAPADNYAVYSTYAVSNVVVTNSGPASLQINIVAPGFDLAWVEFVSNSGPPLAPCGESVVGAGTGVPRGLANGLVASAGNAEVALNWAGSDTAGYYNVKRSTSPSGPFVTIAAPVALGYLDTEASNGAVYTYVVSAVNSYGESANSAVAGAVPSATSLPPLWMDADVGVAVLWDGDAGDVGFPGGASYASGDYTVSGSGIDIWNEADSCHFAFRAVSGDCTLVARVASFANAGGNLDPWAKAGLMIRDSLNQDAANALIAITGGNGSIFSWRPSAGQPSSSASGGGIAPYWVKLTRAGNLLTGYVSAEGESWTEVGSQTVPMASDVFAGLAVTAHNNTQLDTAVFGGVSATVSAPAAPASLTATASPAGVNLAWPAVSAADSYQVERSTNEGGPYTPVAAVIDATHYFDATVSNGVTYYYEVAAVNQNGTGGASPVAAVGVPWPMLAASVAAGGGLTLSWPVAAENLRLYAAYSLSSPVTWTPVANAPQTNGGVVSVALPVSTASAQFFRLGPF